MNTEELIRSLQLHPHPEGGYYRETYRSAGSITNDEGQKRDHCTAIYYLLKNTDKSHFHRIQSDELWFFHQGEPLEIIAIQHGKATSIQLGNDIKAGQVPQVLIPAHTWFAAHLLKGAGFALVSCTVSPGFDFAGFEMAKREELVLAFPSLKELIVEFTR